MLNFFKMLIIMRKIFILIDFFFNVMGVFQYGVGLANVIGNVELILLYIYEVYSNVGMFVLVSDFMKKDVVDQFFEVIKVVELRL